MFNKTNISLVVPSSKNVDRFISFKIKQDFSNEPSEYVKPKKILAVSDIEGNYFAFRRLLLKYKVINNKYEWTFGNGHLVIVGDCFDRGEYVMECLWLIYSLEEKAKKEGGYVHFILGNHEIMNMNGDWRYIHPKYAGNLDLNNTQNVLYHGNNELWRWLRTKNIIEKIGNILFVHAGISEKLLSLKVPISQINNRARLYYTKAGGPFSDPLLEVAFNSDHSPFWYRGYYQVEMKEEIIDATLYQYAINTIITGHTIVERVSSFFNNKVINVNTDHAGGKSEALLIRGDRFFRVSDNGKSERIK